MTETPVLEQPAVAATSTPLADLTLVRLLPTTKTRPNAKKITADLAPFFRRPPAAEAITAAMDQLRAAGLMTALGQNLSAAGRERALAYLGAKELPAKATWAAVKAKLVPKALGLSAGSADTADKLAAVLLKRKLGLPVGTGNTLAAVLTALACRAAGFPDVVVGDLRQLRPHLLGKALDSTDVIGPKDAPKVIPAAFLNPPKKGLDGLRALALKGWADGGAGVAHDETFDLGDFAATVVSVARRCPTGRFGDNKVFISHVWRELKGDQPFRRLGFDGFKAKLVEANQLRLLDLRPADLNQAFDPADVAESATTQFRATYHFIATGDAE